MMQLDNADASQELQVALVSVVRLASGTTVCMDACVSSKIKELSNPDKICAPDSWLSMMDGKLISLDNQKLVERGMASQELLCHSCTSRRKKQTGKDFSSFQLHIQTQTKTSFIVYLLIFKKQFHISLFLDPQHISQFSKQRPQIIHDLDNLAQLLWCLLYSINDFGISLSLFKIHLFI
jgi:hypothetical protein